MLVLPSEGLWCLQGDVAALKGGASSLGVRNDPKVNIRLIPLRR